MSDTRDWALILGASSGFGAAAARTLAREGFDIFGVFLERRAAMPRVEALQAELEAAGARVGFFNVNAASAEKRAATLDAMAERVGPGGHVRVLLHSLAFGALRPFIAAEPRQAIEPRQMDMTCDVMAHSLVYWTQDLVRRRLMRRGGRVFAMTSAGSLMVSRAYGAVSAAKAALESHCRQLAAELGPAGITVNALLGGVTDTAALRKIPGHEALMAAARARNPQGRLTTPEDVAAVVALLARPEAQWVSGNTIHVDGGETITGADWRPDPSPFASEEE